MALTTTQINELYLAYFGRPADFNGFGFWQTALTPIIASNGFSSSPEFSSTHGQASAITLCTALYNNLFNRTPDTLGLNFWTNALNNGLSLPDLITNMIAAARGAAGTDAATLTNKLNAAQTFTTSLDTSTKISAYEQKLTDPAIKALMDAASTGLSPSALEALVQQTVNTLLGNTSAPDTTPPAPAPQTFILTSDADTFNGGAADDIFKGVVNGGATTYQSSDVLNGGGGTDQLQLEVSNSFVLNSNNISNIERLVLKVTNANSTVAIANLKDFTRIENVDSSASLTIGDSVDRLTSIPRLDITRSTGQTTLNFDTSALSGAADKIDVYVTDTGSLGSLRNLVLTTPALATNQFETVHLNVTGTNGIALRTDNAQTTLSTLEIDGSGSLVLALAQSNDNINSTLTTIQAGAATGNLTIGGIITSLTNKIESVTLGSGNDVLYIGGNLTSAMSLSGGAGTDTLVVNRAITALELSKVSGFDVLRFDFTGSPGTVTQDTSLWTGGTSFEVIGSSTTLNLNNLANNAAVKVLSATSTLNLALADDTGLADSLTLTLNGNGALAILNDVTGLETLNLVTQGASNSITANFATAKHVITGSGNLSMEGAFAATQVDASPFTGNLKLQAAIAGSTITAGSGNDEIIGNAGADIINVGTGNNVVKLGTLGANATSGADRITLGSGNDTVVFVGNQIAGNGNASGNATTFEPFAKVSNFTVGAAGSTDLLAFSAHDSDFSLLNVSGLAKGTAAQGLTGGLNAGDAMVVQVGTGGGVAVNDVSFIKFTGDVSINTAPDIRNFFAGAFSGASVSGLTADGNYLISAFDTTTQAMVVAVINVGTDGVLNTSDLLSGVGIAIVGTIGMSRADYDAFDATQLGVAI